MSDSKQSNATSADRIVETDNSKAYWWLPHVVLVIVACLAGSWSLLVQKEVPEPYLVR